MVRRTWETIPGRDQVDDFSDWNEPERTRASALHVEARHQPSRNSIQVTPANRRKPAEKMLILIRSETRAVVRKIVEPALLPPEIPEVIVAFGSERINL